MSYLDTAIKRLQQSISAQIERHAPFRSTVASTDGDLVYITRPGASTADAEPAAKVTSDLLSVGDEVMVLPVLGKPVVMGEVRRSASPGTASNALYHFSGGFGGRAATTGNIDTVATAAQTLPAGTYIWMGVTKLTAQPSGGDASGWLTIRRDDIDAEITNGASQIVYSSTGGRWTCVTTRTGTITLGGSTSMSFRARWAGANGTLIQNAAELSVLLFRTR